MLLALTREISAAIARCELTHLERTPIDFTRAQAQHSEYESHLRAAGCRVERLSADADMPDSVFIEDTAVVFDELAVIARPGALSRRLEIVAVGAVLERYRPVRWIEAPGTLDGGDVLVVARRVFVGISSRTNAAAVAQMTELLRPYDYEVMPVHVRGCLHLKSAVTRLGDELLLVNPEWLPIALFRPFEVITVDPDEPAGANALTIGERVIASSAFPKTADRLTRRGLVVSTIETSELAKAEGGLTCCSLILEV
jgi:dimethylargininase